MSAWLQAQSQHLRAVVWLEGDGFWPAAFRGLVSTFIMATGQRSTITIVGAGDELIEEARLRGAEAAGVRAFFADARSE